MGQSVLANQFISGLQPVLKSKVVGTESNLEQLLVKACFEEANICELPRVAHPRGFHDNNRVIELMNLKDIIIVGMVGHLRSHVLSKVQQVCTGSSCMETKPTYSTEYFCC